MKISQVIFGFEKWFAVVLYTLMFGITFAQVVARYFFNTGWTWVPEIAVLTCITLTYVGASTGIKSNVHIGVDVIVTQLPKWTHKYFDMFSSVCSFVLYSFMTYVSLKFILFFRDMGNESLVIPGLPLWVLICYMPLGFLLMTFHSAESLWSKLQQNNHKLKDNGS
jgi:C4-dicarboxylate transporter, DctQ subunit